MMLSLESARTRFSLTWLIVLVIAPVAQAVSWFDDFNDGNAEDGNPLTWTHNEVGFTPGMYDATSGDYILSNPGGGSDDSMIPTVNVNFSGDVYVRTQAVVLPGMLPEQVGGTLGVVARWDPFSVSGYVALLSNGAHLQLILAQQGIPTNIAEARNLPIDTNSDALIELDIVGSQLSVFVWRPGEPKPTEPTVTAIDTVFESGRAGLLHNENHDSVQGVFRFAAAQDVPFVDVVPGDFNDDGNVDAADYVVWRDTAGSQEDYNLWRKNFGPSAAGLAASLGSGSSSAVPEASSMALFLLGIASLSAPFRRSLSRYRAQS